MNNTNVKNQPTVAVVDQYTIHHITSKDGTTIGYRQLGHGPGIVLLHGGMESAQSHIQLAEALADTFTIYLPDRRGRGMSGPYGKDYGIQKEVDDIDALLNKTGAYNVFGFSSAAIVLLYAALRQSTIHKAVSFEPPLFNVTDDWLPRFDQEIAEGRVAAALATSTKGTQMWGHAMPRWLLELATKMIMASEDKKAKGNDVTMRKLAPTLHYDAQLIIESKEALESFRAIHTHVLLMGGSLSPAFLKAGLDALERVLPDAQRVEIPGSGHGASGNTNRGGKPDVVAQELRRFFRRTIKMLKQKKVIIMTTTKAHKGLPMEGMIATWYAKTTLKDLKRHKLMASQLVKNIPAGGNVLEIAPGPGYFCIELAKLGNFQITGMDISKSFVEIARENAKEAGLKIDFQEGNASAMPFRNGTFDFIFCQAAFKNFSEPVKAITEIYRVLKSNGIAVIADMRRDASNEEIEREVKSMRLGLINEFVVRWTFKHMLVKSAYSVRDMESMISQTPFGKGRIDTDGIGFQAWLEK